ncbi:MAG: cytidylate kinase-like family protein [Lachnospiraceae bacterium]|nr:cytidylate kinase-like family protein [Lachnospiraceae bacterium]
MEKQIIIAVSREFGSGGHAVAEKIAEDLGLAFYDRKMLDEIAKEKNIKIEYLEKYDEKPRKIILSRRVGNYSNSIEEILAEMQFEYIAKKADSGESFVIVGRCAETVLKDREGLISIFILGDREDKIKRVQERTGLDREQTIAKMKRHDFTRKHYHNRHSDKKWGDSRNYDLCVNSSKLGLDKTVEVIEAFIKARISE